MSGLAIIMVAIVGIGVFGAHQREVYNQHLIQVLRKAHKTVPKPIKHREPVTYHFDTMVIKNVEAL